MDPKFIFTFKDQDALLDYYYDALPESERYLFLMQLLEKPLEFEVEFHELFLDSPEYNESNYEAITAFAARYCNLRPEEYSRTYELIELALTDIAFYLKDKEQIDKSLAVLKGNPVTGIDTVVKKVLFQLLFNGYYQEAVEFSKAVWKPLAESEKLLGYPEYIFTYTIYLSKLEKQYELLRTGNGSDWKKFLKEVKDMGFDISRERMDPIYSIFTNPNCDDQQIVDLPNGKQESLLITNIHFLVYMKKMYNVPFILSEWWFNLLHGKDLFKKSNEPGAEFYIPYREMDKYITGQLDTFFHSNFFELYGKIWGLHYVYEFFHKASLISEPWYTRMTENIALLKKEFTRLIGKDIWQMHYITRWPGKDIPGNLALTEDFFNQSFTARNAVNERSIDNSIGMINGEQRIKEEIKDERIREGRYSPAPQYVVKDPDQPYQKQGDEPGRNDSCPCGSGKKYKKCCMK